MYSTGPRPQRNQHLFTAPALGLAFSGLALVTGLSGVVDAWNNPAPTVHPCRAGLVAELGSGAWVDVSACELDLDDAVILFEDGHDDAVFVPLVDPDSGDQAGILKSDNPLVLEAIDSPGHDSEEPPTDAEVAAASILFGTPRIGMTVRLQSDDRKVLRKSLRDLGEDEAVVELGEAPEPTQSLIVLLLGVVGVSVSAWGVVRAQRAKRDEEAQLAAWHAAAASQNPYLR